MQKVSNYLFHLGIVPTPDFKGVIKAPYRDDKNPSFLITKSGNSFIDYSTDQKGGIVELVELMQGIKGVRECLTHFEQVVGQEPKKFNNKYLTFDPKKSKRKFTDEFVKSQKVEDTQLINYLRERGIISFPHWLEEVHLKRGRYLNKYVGIKNLSNGYNLRNREYKKGFQPSDIAVFKGTSGRVVVVEGLFDGLSWYQVRKQDDTLIILNSTAHISKFIKLAKKSKAKEFLFYLDNGMGGDIATIKAKLELGEDRVIDCRKEYKKYDDLNDALRGIKKVKKEDRVAYVKGTYYIKMKDKDYIQEFEGYSLKSIKEEILK